MIFKNGIELIDAFNELSKDIAIIEIRNNGSVTQYLADTFLNSIEIKYLKNNIDIIYIGLKQEGSIKKIKYFPNQSLSIKFANETILKDADR